MKRDNKKTGIRLRECMEKSNITAGMLNQRIRALYPQRFSDPKKAPIPPANLSSYKNGTPISEDRIELIAQALHIHKGYLLGDDDYLCKTYKEYTALYNVFQNPRVDEVFRLFSPAGFDFSGTTTDDFDQSVLYSVTDKKNGINKQFSEDEMDLLYNKVIETIRDYFNDFVTTNNWNALDNDEVERYAKWHPDFDRKQIETLIQANNMRSDLANNVARAVAKQNRKAGTKDERTDKTDGADRSG